MNKTKLISSLGGAIAVSLLADPLAQATENPFAMQKVSNATQLAEASDKGAEGKCSDGKCGDKMKEGKCSDGKCGDKMAAAAVWLRQKQLNKTARHPS